MRIMGIDFGDARTGLAVSDEMNILVGDAWTLNQRKPELVAESSILKARFLRHSAEIVLREARDEFLLSVMMVYAV